MLHHFAPSISLKLLWHERLLPLFGLILGLLVALLIIQFSSTKFEAQILITSSAPLEKYEWDSIADKIGSAAFLDKIVDSLTPLETQKKFESFRALNLNGREKTINTDQSQKNLREHIANSLNFKTQENALRLIVAAQNPAEAAKLANLIVQHFEEEEQNKKVAKAAQTNAKIRAEIIKKRRALIEAQSLLEQYKRANPIVNKTKNPQQNLGLKIASEQAELKALETVYGEKHPKIIAQKAKLAALNSANIPQHIPDSQQSLIAQTIESLAQDVEIKRLDLEQFIKENGAGLSLWSKQNGEVQTAQIFSQMRMVQDAQTDRQLLLALSLLGLLCGLLAIVLKTRLNPVFISLLSLPKSLKTLQNFGVINPQQSLDLKTLRHDVRLRFEDAKLITLIPQENPLEVTKFAYQWAQTIAKTGEKTLIIDCNWQKPQLQLLRKNAKTNTIIDYLTNAATLDQTLNRLDELPNLHLLYGGALPQTSMDMISSSHFSSLLLSLKQIYALIILVAPPAQLGADARILAKLSDSCLLPFLAYNTSLTTAQKTAEILEHSQVKNCGIFEILYKEV